MTDKVQYWITLAKEDIPVAQSLLSSGHLLCAGFITHLAVEKALKAKIESGGETPPRIHNLVRLAEMSVLLAQMNDEQIETLKMLNPLQIEARYPVYRQAAENALTMQECGTLLAQAKELIKWIEQRL